MEIKLPKANLRLPMSQKAHPFSHPRHRKLSFPFTALIEVTLFYGVNGTRIEVKIKVLQEIYPR